MADGSITFDATLSTKQLETELKRVRQKIMRLQEDAYSTQGKAYPLAKDVAKLNAELSEAIKKYRDMKSAPKRTYTNEEFSSQRSVIQGIRDQLNPKRAELESLTSKYDEINAKIEQHRSLEGELTREIQTRAESEKEAGNAAEETANSTKHIGEAASTSESMADKLSKRLIGLAKRVFIFSVITKGLRKVREYLGSMIMQNKDAAQAVAQLRGALATLAQPIVQAVIPAFISLIKVLTQVVAALAAVTSKLLGTTAKKSADAAKALNSQAKGYGNVGKAANKAKRELMSFDEINKLSDDDDGSGGSGAAPTDFSVFTGENDDSLAQLGKYILMIGAALATWKIASNFTSDLKTILGFMMMIAGAIGLAIDATDAWQNGVNWNNLNGMLKDIALAALGAALAFGVTGFAVALLVGGIALLVVGIKDFIETGEMSDATFAAIVSGLLLVGGAIMLLTGSWIPMLIAFIAAIVVTIFKYGDQIKGYLQAADDWLQNVFAYDFTELFGHVLGEALNVLRDEVKAVWDGIKNILDGVIDFINGVFTGNWKKAWEGIKEIFAGIVNTFVDVFKAPINGMIRLINSVIDSMNTLSFDIPNWVPGIGGEHYGVNIDHIPELANGAVIPPNRRFLAMLGDQPHGTNIEAPLDTIKQAVAEVMNGGEIVQLLSQLIQVTQSVADRPIEMDGARVTNIVSNRQSEISRMWG